MDPVQSTQHHANSMTNKVDIENARIERQAKRIIDYLLGKMSVMVSRTLLNVSKLDVCYNKAVELNNNRTFQLYLGFLDTNSNINALPKDVIFSIINIGSFQNNYGDFSAKLKQLVEDDNKRLAEVYKKVNW